MSSENAVQGASTGAPLVSVLERAASAYAPVRRGDEIDVRADPGGRADRDAASRDARR